MEEFWFLLTKFEIQAVVDVRRFPVSKFDHFKKDSLASTLHRWGIRYFYMGDILGGFRKGGYEEFTHTPKFVEGVKRLEDIASRFTTAFICAEKFPWRCHRRFIALKLVQDGWRVIHILDKERIWEPKKRPIPEI